VADKMLAIDVNSDRSAGQLPGVSAGMGTIVDLTV